MCACVSHHSFGQWQNTKWIVEAAEKNKKKNTTSKFVWDMDQRWFKFTEKRIIEEEATEERENKTRINSHNVDVVLLVFLCNFIYIRLFTFAWECIHFRWFVSYTIIRHIYFECDTSSSRLRMHQREKQLLAWQNMTQ